MREETAMVTSNNIGDDNALSVTLSRLRSECETCGEWSSFTGRTEVREGRTYAIMRCPNGACGSTRSTQCTAVTCARYALQEGHTPRPLKVLRGSSGDRRWGGACGPEA